MAGVTRWATVVFASECLIRTVGAIISIPVASLSHEDLEEILPDDKAHLIVLPVASITCRSGSGRRQAAALSRRTNHDNHSPLGRRRFTNLWPRCNQREDYHLAVGLLCRGFIASAAKPSDSIRVVFIHLACHVRLCIFFGLKLRC